ncbi:MAG: hypothetical protein QOD30_2478 [Actinomycetota bacterium]|nr:hypothetical protein [Actinomycetota bacterium]
MREALALLDAVDDDRLRHPFESDERTTWFYTPTDHGGVPLGALTPSQQQLVFELLAAALPATSYNTACTIIGLENVLDRQESFRARMADRERTRDVGLYYVAVFGDPHAGTWAFSFGGHHVSVHRTFVDGALVAATPSFLGANPADARLLGGQWLRPLAVFEDLGRDLVHALPDAVVTPHAPHDMASGNRAFLSEGDAPLHLFALMRGGSGDPPEVDDAIPLTRTPRAGVTSADLQPLVDVYCEHVPDLSLDASTMRFLWAGGIEKGEPHYYRLQSDDWLIEYDNVQNDANHIHTVVRSWDGDFGRDVLSAHHATHH